MKTHLCILPLIGAALLILTAGARVPEPEKHTIVPDRKAARHSPCRGTANFGKTIAVFGGSLSVNEESDAAKRIWADLLGATVTTYGVGGAGFSIDQGYSIQKQVDMAGKYDIYILWASTNDFTKGREIGSWKDYTSADGFDKSRLSTQCGGINYCIRTILEKNPHARILFFTSLRFFKQESGYDPFSEVTGKAGATFADYVKAQKECCEHYGIPVLDQFGIQGVNEFNYTEYYKADRLHMTEDGYRFIGPAQAAFIAGF